MDQTKELPATGQQLLGLFELRQMPAASNISGDICGKELLSLEGEYYYKCEGLETDDILMINISSSVYTTSIGVLNTLHPEMHHCFLMIVTIYKKKIYIRNVTI